MGASSTRIRMGLPLAEGRALALKPHQQLRAVGEEVPLPRGIAAVRVVHQRGGQRGVVRPSGGNKVSPSSARYP